MEELIFRWTAIFNDGSVIRQYENNIENRFQEVQNRFNELCYFNLTDCKGHFFTVNLKDGLIGYNDLIMPYRKSNEKKDNIRLIFFRRHRVEMSEKFIEKNHIIEYHLGMQWNSKEGNNRQIVLIIDATGSWHLGE